MITRAFTCTGPYAILIMLGIKRVENRSAVPVPGKGRCAVSCSKSFGREEFGNFVQWASRALDEADFARLPSWSDVRDWPGKVIGCCDYSVRERGSAKEAWDEGYPYFWELSNVVCLDSPIACRGNVGMWKMPESLARQVSVSDSLAQAVGTKIATAEDAVRLFRLAIPIAGSNEGFFVLPLDEGCRVLSAPVLVSLGEAHTTTVDPSEAFGEALKVGAKSIIVAHNHPSGNPKPSADDIRLTNSLKSAAEMLHVRFVDHVVIGDGSFVSLKHFL